jgi:lysophospholipase L1-like esterase
VACKRDSSPPRRLPRNADCRGGRLLASPPRAGKPDHAQHRGIDVQAVSDACGQDFSCARARAPRATRKFASRLGSILRRLRSAAPSAEIIVIGLWNNDVDTPRKSDPLIQSVNKTIVTVTTPAKGRFADVFPAFNPQGNLARERARICAFTFLCSKGDGHPTNAGYRAIAAAVWAASGYAHRS